VVVVVEYSAAAQFSCLLAQCKLLSKGKVVVVVAAAAAVAARRWSNEEGRSEGRLGSSFQTASIAFYVVLNVEKHDGKACDITC
jgi:hypothetical protein